MKRIVLSVAAICFAAVAGAQELITQTPETMALRDIKDPAVLKAKLNALESSGSDQDYGTLYTYYRVRNSRLSDSIAKVAITKFPKGSVALKRASGRVLSVKSAAEQDAVLTEMRKEFPGQDFNFLYAYIIRSFLTEKNAQGALKYLKLSSGSTKSSALRSTIGTASFYDVKAAAAYVADELANGNPSPQDKLTLLLAQSEVLTRAGDYQKAFQSVKAYYDQLPEKTPEAEAAYYKLMSKTGKQTEAFPYLEKAVIARIGGKDMTEELKAAYVKLNPGKDAETYLSGLTGKIDHHKQDEVAKLMISEKAPEFSVLDANGKTVSLADFKGKTLVIDFWATWCGPCKISLPGMQATVNKYKNDPNVAFLFIHTWEGKGKDANPTEAAKKYFAENNYGNLPLYMDLEGPNKKNPAVSAFKVTGIPTKFVINGNGEIRFRHTGGNANVDEVVAELSAMIELSKKGTK